MEVEKNKGGTGLKDSLQDYLLSCGWLWLSSKVLTEMNRNNKQGFLKAKMNLLLKKLYAWDTTCLFRNLIYGHITL